MQSPSANCSGLGLHQSFGIVYSFNYMEIRKDSYESCHRSHLDKENILVRPIRGSEPRIS